MIESPDKYNKSIRVRERDLEKLRGIVGNNDAHRVRIARIKNGSFRSYDFDGRSETTLRLNKEDKEFIESLPGKTHTEKFYNFVKSIEDECGVDLQVANNVVP